MPRALWPKVGKVTNNLFFETRHDDGAERTNLPVCVVLCFDEDDAEGLGELLG